MTKVAIYIRVSTTAQETDRQREELESYAKVNDFEVVSIYEDKISGFKTEEQKPEFSRLKEDAKKGKFKMVLFSEFTRLARKLSEINKQIEDFQRLNIYLYFQKQNITVKEKTDISTGLFVQILAFMASYEAEQFVERSVSGKISKLKKENAWFGGNAVPFGYKKLDKKILIDEENAKIVREIFELYDGGMTSVEIPKYLFNKGFTQFKKAGRILKLLNNEIYIGNIQITFHKPILEKSENPEILKKQMQDREIIEEVKKHDEKIRIVSDELFNSVQDKIKYNNNNKNKAKKHPNLLKKLLKCGMCGNNFMSGKANDYRVYRCYKGVSSNISPTETRCYCSYIKQDKLNGIIISAASDFILSDKKEKDLLLSKKKFNDEKEILIKRLSVINEVKDDNILSIKKYINTVSMSKYTTEDEIKSFILKKEAEIESNKLEIREITNKLKVIEKGLKSLDITPDKIERTQTSSVDDEGFQYYNDTNNFEEIKMLLEELIEKITISSIDRKLFITIYYYNSHIETIIATSSRDNKKTFAQKDNKGRDYYFLPIFRGEINVVGNMIKYKNELITVTDLLSDFDNSSSKQFLTYTNFEHHK